MNDLKNKQEQLFYCEECGIKINPVLTIKINENIYCSNCLHFIKNYNIRIL